MLPKHLDEKLLLHLQHLGVELEELTEDHKIYWSKYKGPLNQNIIDTN